MTVSITSECSIETAAWMDPAGFGIEAAVSKLRSTLCYTGIPPKVRILFSGTMSQTANFAVFLPFRQVKVVRRKCCEVSSTVAYLSWNSMGPTPTPTRTLGMRLSCNFVNVYSIAYRVQYTCTRVHARIPSRHPREDLREEKRACRTCRRTRRRGSSCVSGSWQAS